MQFDFDFQTGNSFKWNYIFVKELIIEWLFRQLDLVLKMEVNILHHFQIQCFRYYNFFIHSFLGNQLVWHLRRKRKLWFVLFRFPWQVSAWGEFPVFIWIVTGNTNLRDPSENWFLEMWISTWTIQQLYFKFLSFFVKPVQPYSRKTYSP